MNLTKRLLISMLTLLCCCTGVWATSLMGSGTEAEPYLISSADDWNEFCDNIATYKSSYIKMTADVTGVSKMAGSSDNYFAGIFDGDLHTLDVSISVINGNNANAQYVAPFSRVRDGTIKNLHVTGSVTASGYSTGGLIGWAENCTIYKVIVSASVTNHYNPPMGGFIGDAKGSESIYFTDCLFDGELNSNVSYNVSGHNTNWTNKVAGFVGWDDGGKPVMTRCLFDSSTVPSAGFHPVAVAQHGSWTGASATKVYYTTAKSDGFPSDFEASNLAGESKVGASNSSIVNSLGSEFWEEVDGKVVPKWSHLDELSKDGDDYVIATHDDWMTFCAQVNAGYHTYSGMTVKLTANITDAVTAMVGASETKSFQGTFDGQGYTVNVNIESTTDNTAPFSWVKNATIKNLKVTGETRFTTSPEVGFGDATSGLIGLTFGTVNVQNVKSSVRVRGYNYYGGLIGHGENAIITMTGCVFDGSLEEFTANSGTTIHAGGLIGWGERTMSVTITDCLFAGTYTIGSGGSGNHNFHPVGYYRAYDGTITDATLRNVYYTVAATSQDYCNWGTTISSEAKLARTISTSDANVTTLGISGMATEYYASGMTSYSTGIMYNSMLYAGSGDEVSLTLGHADREGYTFSQYEVTGGGSLNDATSNTPTLTMTDANQTISAAWTKNEVALTDGNDLTALTAYAGKTCKVAYSRSLTNGKTSTVCLPFAYTKKGAEGSFYEFTSITKEGSEYVATMTEPGVSTLTANTPYLFTPAATGNVDFSGTYEIPADLSAGSTVSGDWTYLGTYETIEWTEAPTGIYGFSAQDVNEQGISQGQFVKVDEYVRIKPMRCYLKYKNGAQDYAGARAMTRGTEAEQLPETIKVRLIGANGEVTGIGSLQTKTGEIIFDSDAWYTLDGVQLDGKPTRKGIYVNNGKKVIIK